MLKWSPHKPSCAACKPVLAWSILCGPGTMVRFPCYRLHLAQLNQSTFPRHKPPSLSSPLPLLVVLRKLSISIEETSTRHYPSAHLCTTYSKNYTSHHLIGWLSAGLTAIMNVDQLLNPPNEELSGNTSTSANQNSNAASRTRLTAAMPSTVKDAFPRTPSSSASFTVIAERPQLDSKDTSPKPDCTTRDTAVLPFQTAISRTHQYFDGTIRNEYYEDAPRNLSPGAHVIRDLSSVKCYYLGCDSVFTGKHAPRNLRRHMEQHDGKVTYKCIHCDRSYRRGDNLKKHQDVKHSHQILCVMSCARST
jgi:hypothetical protein